MVNDGTITFNDARIIFRNLAGNGGPYNREGDRNFCVVIPPELVEPLREDGWNIKERPPRDQGDQPLYYLTVKVNYKGRRPPRVVIISSRGRTDLDESGIEIIDWVDIRKVDLIVRPYKWDVRGEVGISAYLKTMFITILEDELELRYADVPEARQAIMVDAEVVDEIEGPRQRAIEGRR